MYVSFPGKCGSESDSYGYMRVYFRDDIIFWIQDDDVYRRILSYIPSGSGAVVSDCAGIDHSGDDCEYL